MTTTDITKAILLLFACVLLLWDVVVFLNAIPGDTISEVVAGWSWRCQSVPLGVGVVAGQNRWPAVYARKRSKKRCRVRLLWVLGAVALAADIWLVGQMMPAFPMVVGIVAGRLLWAQAPHPRRPLRYG